MPSTVLKHRGLHINQDTRFSVTYIHWCCKGPASNWQQRRGAAASSLASFVLMSFRPEQPPSVLIYSQPRCPSRLRCWLVLRRIPFFGASADICCYGEVALRQHSQIPAVRLISVEMDYSHAYCRAAGPRQQGIRLYGLETWSKMRDTVSSIPQLIMGEQPQSPSSAFHP